ncbi:MAG: hypothetical protein ACI8S6_003779 [Myxococcota bacterium]|jgi:hypothetical protein
MEARGALLVASLLALIGCGSPCDEEWIDSGGMSEDGESDPYADLSFRLSPDVAQAGDVFITSLVADGVADFDYGLIAELDFYGDVQVCTMQARGDELLISIGVSGSAPTREIDLVVVLEDGETIYVEAALTILGSEGGGSASTDGAMCAG